ncbi:MAG: PepSY-like domain-containing protein [Bacteroidales bacterium]|nr:PepSY-like domain-containing protein [Bacteroidales bacterium]
MFFLMCFIVLHISACASGDKPISKKDLPQAAQTFIQTYFSDKAITLVKQDTDVARKTYDVVFADGTEVEFNGKGLWTEVSTKTGAVPQDLVPETIRTFVSGKYAGQTICRIERERAKTEVKLSNGLELTFNKDGRLIDIDN